MSSVFGLPAAGLAVLIGLLLVAVTCALAVVAVRNRVFFRMAMRNIRRRRGRSVLIMAGLMLGTTIMCSALLTGDTMSRTMRSDVFESLGVTDVSVTASSTESGLDGGLTVTAVRPYFDAAPATRAVRQATAGSDLVDAVAPAIVEPVAAQASASRQTEPRVTLFAAVTDSLGALGLAAAADLEPGETLLDDDAADELDARVGDPVTLLAGDRTADLIVRGIGDYQGTGTPDAAAVVSLATAQSLLDKPGQVNHILVSNQAGVSQSDAVVERLESAVEPLGLRADPVKQDALDDAQEQGDAFLQLFTTFGSFSLVAGVLLIFLIFVMLAAERRSELGMARAIGTRRGHLVQMFLFEGVVYDLIAAAVGALLGVGVSLAIVAATAAAFDTQTGGLDLEWGVRPRTMLIGYGLGVLLTFAVVTVSAWRVSRLTVVSALRDLPEPVQARDGRRRWLLAAAAFVVGVLLAVSGGHDAEALPWMLGVSLAVVALIPLLQRIRVSPRITYTAAGAFLVVWWLLPLDFFAPLFGEMSMDFSIWLASGLLLVLGTTWVVIFNADLVLRAFSGITSRLGSLGPALRLAMAYPLRSRFRTGVTLAMFTLVVFTLVTGTTISTAFIRAFDDEESFGGGFDVRASTAPALAVDDLRAAVPTDLAADITAVGAQSYLPMEVHQDGTADSPADYPIRGLDDGFLEHNRYRLATMATGYGSPDEVWAAVRDDPGLAVVDPYVVPRRQSWGAGVLPDLQLSGFHLEDSSFDPVPLTVTDSATGTQLHLTVIGVLRDDIPFEMAGISVSQDVLGGFGDRARPTVQHVALASGVDADEFARRLEAAMLANAMEAQSYSDVLDDAVSGSLIFNRLILAFMMLGLVVGVAALGVISARSVVERRQQLGVLRSIGFQRATVRHMVLLEAGFVAVTSVLVGTATGLVTAYNVISDSAEQTNYTDVTFGVPWANLLVVFAGVLVAVAIAAVVPAIRASRVYPAEALRYQ